MATNNSDPIPETSTPCRPAVRRRLDFGPADRGEEEPNLSASLTAPQERAQQVERQRAREKWNFDFENEVPLDGDWEWEKVEREQVPEVKEVVSSMVNVRKENRNL